MEDLRVINREGTFVVDSREVANMVGKEHKNLLRSINGYVEILTGSKLRSLDFFIPNKYNDIKGEERPCYLLTKKGCDMVANKMTGEKGILFTAAYVTKFEEMEKAIKQLNAEINYLQQLEGVKFIADDLKVNQASKILMYQKVCQANGVNPSFLPTYSDEKVTKSLTELLKQFNVGVSTIKFNNLLMDNGLLKECTRPSSKNPDKPKKYKALTDEGLKYGKNLISPHNQKETQPHYYEDSFMELVGLMLK